MPPKRSYRKSSRRPYKKRAYKKRSTVSKSVRRYVKKVVHSNIENKIVNVNQTKAFGNIFQSPDLSLYPMLPYTGYTTIPQGVGQGSRIANRCKVRKVILKYVLMPVVQDASVNPSPLPSMVQIFLLRLKQNPGLLPTATQLQNIVQVGSTTTSLSGTVSDIALNSWNQDLFYVKTFVHRVGYSSVNGAGSSAGAQFYNNNDYSLSVIRKHDITKLVASEMVFDDGNSTHLRKNIFFGFQCVNPLGTVLSSTQTPVRINWWCDIIYEDA